MALLIYKDPGGRYVDFLVPSTRFTIGRSMEADIHIDDKLISRVHCEIRREAGHFVIRDLESRNGTWVNEQRVHESPLKFGDAIRLGHTIFALQA